MSGQRTIRPPYIAFSEMENSFLMGCYAALFLYKSVKKKKKFVIIQGQRWGQDDINIKEKIGLLVIWYGFEV